MKMLWSKKNGAAVECEKFAPGNLNIRTNVKISHWCEKFALVRNFHTLLRSYEFPAFFALVSCIISFKNLTKTVKINTGKIKKKCRKMKNKLETKIKLKLEEI